MSDSDANAQQPTVSGRPQEAPSIAGVRLAVMGALDEILFARARLQGRGVEPSRLEVGPQYEIWAEKVLGLEVRQISSAEQSAVLGRRKHGKYECVPWEREPLEPATGASQ